MRAAVLSVHAGGISGQCNLPHIDMEVLREIRSKTRRGGGPTDRLHSKVVRLARPVHAELSKIERTGPKGTGTR